MRSKPIQTLSSCSTRSTSSSISALLRQHGRPNSSTCENFPPSLSETPISRRHSSSIETSFIVHSFLGSTHLVGDQEPNSSLSAIISTVLPYLTLGENSKPLRPDIYHYPLRLDNQMIIHPRQDLRYHILLLDGKNNSRHSHFNWTKTWIKCKNLCIKCPSNSTLNSNQTPIFS